MPYSSYRVLCLSYASTPGHGHKVEETRHFCLRCRLAVTRLLSHSIEMLLALHLVEYMLLLLLASKCFSPCILWNICCCSSSYVLVASSACDVTQHPHRSTWCLIVQHSLYVQVKKIRGGFSCCSRLSYNHKLNPPTPLRFTLRCSLFPRTILDASM